MPSLYDSDILLWSEQQAELLRRLARGERVNGVDWDNVIEELESVGRNELHAVGSHLRVALTHFLLAHASPRPEPVAHWRAEARAALADAARAYAPSMAQRLDLAREWRTACRIAADKLALDGGPARSLPADCPFALAELVQDDPDLGALLARLATA